MTSCASLSGCSFILDFSDKAGVHDASIDGPYTAAECAYKEPNDTPDTAAVITTPEVFGCQGPGTSPSGGGVVLNGVPNGTSAAPGAPPAAAGKAVAPLTSVDGGADIAANIDGDTDMAATPGRWSDGGVADIGVTDIGGVAGIGVTVVDSSGSGLSRAGGVGLAKPIWGSEYTAWTRFFKVSG